MLNNPYKRYRVKWNMGLRDSGSNDYDTLEEAQDFFVLCFNQLHEGDNGHNLNTGQSKIQMFDNGMLMIDTAREAARS